MSLGYHEGQNVFTRAFKVDAGVTNLKRGTFVDLNSSSKLIQSPAAAKAIGVALEDWDADGGAFPNQVWPTRAGVAVRIMGTAMVEAAGAIDAGAEVEVGSNGLAATHATGVVVGVALTGAAAAGDIIEVLLK